MKNIQLISCALFLLTLLSACSDDEIVPTPETQQPDSSIIAEYQFDTQNNPMYETLSNLKYLFGFKNVFHDFFDNSLPVFTINENNIIEFKPDNDGPDQDLYQYEYNSINLPIKNYKEHYYAGTLEITQYHYSSYYYQGNIIPE